MAANPYNSKGGFSTGIPANTIVQANGQVTTTEGANITGNLYLGNVANGESNVKIPGATSGQVLATDANGNVIVNLLVEKGTENRYGKIQETIPAGYRAQAITESSDAPKSLINIC